MTTNLPTRFQAQALSIDVDLPHFSDRFSYEDYVEFLRVNLFIADIIAEAEADVQFVAVESGSWTAEITNHELIQRVLERLPDYSDEEDRFYNSVEAAEEFSEVGIDEFPENLFDYYETQADEDGDQVYVRKNL
jgi:ribonuclease HII